MNGMLHVMTTNWILLNVDVLPKKKNVITTYNRHLILIGLGLAMTDLKKKENNLGDTF